MNQLAAQYPNINALHTALVQAGVPPHESWWLLEKLFAQTRAQLLLQPVINLTAAQLAQLQAWITQLVVQQQPVQYLLGTVNFLDLELSVAPPTLIPRPETEAWCARVITELQAVAPRYVLDLCTGTGCIGLAIAQALPQAQIVAADIAASACALARQNCVRLQLTNFTVYQSDLWQQLPALPYDILVANPPYITTTELADLAPQVREWEDQQALVAGDDGLDVIRQLIQGAQARVIARLYLEIGYQQAPAVSQLLQAAGYQPQVWLDQYGQSRVVVGQLAK